jgi:hypothetical protein
MVRPVARRLVEPVAAAQSIEGDEAEHQKHESEIR